METDIFDSITRKEIRRVKLMNRTNRKFWFHQRQLPIVLTSVKADYFVLEIDGEPQQLLATTYYDTMSNEMYTMHHNGELNRCKIRRRSYLASGISFLEIKFKNNKNQTIKKRISSPYGNNGFTGPEEDFIHANTAFRCEELKPVLINNFSRVTLVNKSFPERCTIDLNLKVLTDTNEISFDNMVIIKIKADRSYVLSALAKVLKDYHINAAGFSKYCIGRTILDQNVKHNAFKAKVRQIENIISN